MIIEDFRISEISGHQRSKPLPSSRGQAHTPILQVVPDFATQLHNKQGSFDLDNQFVSGIFLNACREPCDMNKFRNSK